MGYNTDVTGGYQMNASYTNFGSLGAAASANRASSTMTTTTTRYARTQGYFALSFMSDSVLTFQVRSVVQLLSGMPTVTGCALCGSGANWHMPILDLLRVIQGKSSLYLPSFVSCVFPCANWYMVWALWFRCQLACQLVHGVGIVAIVASVLWSAEHF